MDIREDNETVAKFFALLEQCVGHNLKILDIVKKIWASLGKLFASPGVPSWLRRPGYHYPLESFAPTFS